MPGFELMLMRPSTLDLLHVPLLEDMEGTPRTFAEIFAQMPSQGGLIYGVVDHELANLEGLDLSRLLNLTIAQEALLMAIVGAPSFVRVDGRDTLAMLSSPHLVQVRDMVLGDAVAQPGMRALEAQDLLITQPVDLSPESDEALIKQLIELMCADPSEDLNEEDLRRQALRHVQRFAIRRHFTGGETHGLDTISLLVDLHGRTFSVAQLAQMCAAQGGHILMGDGRAMDLLLRPHSALEAPLSGLAMNPYLAVLLSEFVHVNAAFDFSLELEVDEEDITRANLSSEHFLLGHDISDEELELQGRVGIPLEMPRTATSLLIREDESGRCLALPSLTQDLGIVGVLHVKQLEELDASACEALLYRHASTMLEQLVDTLPERAHEPERWRRSVEVLLSYAEQHLMLTRTEQGLRCQVYHGLSQRILMMPLFDTVGRQPVSAMSLFKSFCMKVDGYAQATDLSEQLDPELDAVLKTWLERNLSLERAVHHKSPPHTRAAQVTAHDNQDGLDTLAATLQRLLATLRPDEYKPMNVIMVRRDHSEDLAKIDAYMGPARAWFTLAPKKRDSSPLLFLDWADEGIVCADASHWLFTALLEPSLDGTPNDDALAWALLAIYAHLNAMLEPVTNHHERDFHVRVMDALQSGQLGA
jgi:hypothetical protein